MMATSSADRLAHVGVDESLTVSRLRALHAGVAPVTRAAKENRLFDTQGSQRGGQLADAVAAQLVGGVDSQLGVPLADDFAFFTEGAGDDVYVGAVGGVVRDGAAGRQRLVVRMGVHEEQTGRFLRRHRLTIISAPRPIGLCRAQNSLSPDVVGTSA